MNALLLLAVLLSPSPARAKAAEDSALEALKAEDPAARERACADLAHAAKRGPNVYPALSLVMDRDISDRVRLAAAKAVLTFPGNEPLTRVKSFLQSEPGEQTRSDMVVTLSTEPSRFEDPGVTDLISQRLFDDPARSVRLSAVLALTRRKDPRALPVVRRIAVNDPDRAIREAAREAVRVLAAVPPPRLSTPLEKPKPKQDAVKGRDACPAPWGWCECDGPIKRPPMCLTHSECRIEIDTVVQLGMPCEWNGASIGAPGD